MTLRILVDRKNVYCKISFCWTKLSDNEWCRGLLQSRVWVDQLLQMYDGVENILKAPLFDWVISQFDSHELFLGDDFDLQGFHRCGVGRAMRAELRFMNPYKRLKLLLHVSLKIYSICVIESFRGFHLGSLDVQLIVIWLQKEEAGKGTIA